MATPRAMPFWAEDWLSSATIALMTPAEEGGLIRLCAHCWLDKDCSLPADSEELRRLSRLDRRIWARKVVQKTLQPHPKFARKLTHPKVWALRQELEGRLAKLAESGKAGAAKRWGGHADANGVAIARPSENDALPSPSPSPSLSQRDARDPSTTTTPASTEHCADVQHLAEYYNRRWSETVGKGKSPRVSAVHPKDYEAGRLVCLGRTDSEVEAIVETYLTLPDEKLRAAGYPFRWLHSRLAQVLAAEQTYALRPFEDE